MGERQRTVASASSLCVNLKLRRGPSGASLIQPSMANEN